ncbi:hypothetical protein C5F59_017265 [Streptomyces sp. QL37]|uniref:hypothetical protein n=1 Tax=Streptomyces sp. QL37 TaxID=2093747 RepID=UPI0021CB80B7|nr:hypothetical protein [Streptomyces sp. QL37]
MTKGPTTPEEPQAEGGHGPRHGIVRTAFGALRRDGGPLFGVTARVTGLAALGGLAVTVVAFLVMWPTFTEIRLASIRAHLDEDSYAPDGSLVNGMWLTLLACLPFLILLLHLGCAAIQTAAARATGEGRGRFRAVLGVYVLRGVLVWAPVVLGILVEEYFTTTTFREYTALVPKWEYPNLFEVLRYGPPLLGMATALVLRLGWTLAPATAATEGLGPRASLRRSWSLVWGRASAWFRTVAFALPLGGLTVGMYVLLHLAARPLRPGTVHVFLEWGPDNTYAAYVVGLLVPIAVALLLTGTLALPPAHAALAVLQRRLVQARERQAAART